jgi:hypothetical protein
VNDSAPPSDAGFVAVVERFYGPCTPCRADLRGTVLGDAKIIDLARYEPKMNVVPNQVATKD